MAAEIKNNVVENTDELSLYVSVMHLHHYCLQAINSGKELITLKIPYDKDQGCFLLGDVARAVLNEEEDSSNGSS